MKIAVVQMVSGCNVQANLSAAQHWVEHAAALGAELVVLPEYFCGMGLRDTDKLAWAEHWGEGPIQSQLAQWAKHYGVWLLGGTLPLVSEEPGRVRNTLAVWSPQGVCAARYDKIHLFRFQTEHERYDESAVIMPGLQPVVLELTDRQQRVWRMGLSVCYDLRFPELYRHYAQQNVDAVVVPSAFTATTGQAHWEVLLRARAIENQCFVIAAAQGGVHENGRHTWGHSMVVDPWGKVLVQQTALGEGLSLAVLDCGLLQQVRSRLPALEHRIL